MALVAKASLAFHDFSRAATLSRRRFAAGAAGCYVGVNDELSLELVRDLAAVFGKLDHHLLMQPDVHRCGIVYIAGVV